MVNTSEIAIDVGIVLAVLLLRHVYSRFLTATKLTLFPELAAVENEKERAEIWDQATLTRHEMPLTLAIIAAAVGLALLLRLAFRVSFPQFTYLLRDFPLSAWLVLVISCGSIPHTWLARRRIARRVRLELRKRGTPLCLRCGYNLTGLASARCPECGSAAELDLCPHCGGAGSLPRFWLFWLGTALVLLWAALVLYFAEGTSRRTPPLPLEKTYFVVWKLPAPIGLSGLILMLCYLAGGSRLRCTHCQGTGRSAATGQGAAGRPSEQLSSPPVGSLPKDAHDAGSRR